MSNSHFVPRLVLRRFSGTPRGEKERITLYNVETGKLEENVFIDRAYAEQDFYDEETEKKLNLRIESQFGNLLANRILKSKRKIELTRTELDLVKKFLLVSIIRSQGSEELMQYEKNFYIISRENKKRFCEEKGIPFDEKSAEPPFEEKQKEGETPFDYWMRTLNVILDTDGTPQEILKHPDVTYPAHRWANVVYSAFVGFWDAPHEHSDEFLITDVGMTSENEVGWNGITVQNHKKIETLAALMLGIGKKDKFLGNEIQRCMNATVYFHENFQMFPISAERMIVLIAPFFKLRYALAKQGVPLPGLEYFTCIPNEKLFMPNGMPKYKRPQIGAAAINTDPDDVFTYETKRLSKWEIRYCNALFMDRVSTHLGFSSLDHAAGSILLYEQTPIPRVDYTALYRILHERGY